MPTAIQNRDEDADVHALHHALVEELKANGNITTEPVAAAFQAVPRHPFLPGLPLEKVYQDQAIPTKFEDGRPISSSSQPAIMAIMLEQLDLQPGQRVLEIGAGTGYNAALMAHIVGPTGHVTTVDLDEDTVAGARGHLAAAGFQQVDVVCGDGTVGYAASAPYDRIILTVGSWDISSAWLDQLKSAGRLLLPLSLNGPQYAVAFERRDGYLASLSIRGCGFMRMRGDMAEPATLMPLGPDPGLLLVFAEAPFAVDAETIYRWLNDPYKDGITGVETHLREVWNSLSLWLALADQPHCTLSAQGDAADKNIVPHLFSLDGESKWRTSNGLLGESGLGLLTRPPAEQPAAEPANESPPSFPLLARGFGPDKTVAHNLAAQVQAWDEAGRPDIDGLRIRAYPTGAYTPAAGERVLAKQWHDFVLDWK